MRFELLDHIIEHTEDRIVAVKLVSLAEEYLADHFPTFPVLPGVLMIEIMTQAARRLIEGRPGCADLRFVLGEVRALKFGAMVRPGESLRVTVSLVRENEDRSFVFKGFGIVIGPRGEGAAQRANSACSGRFSLRPVRL